MPEVRFTITERLDERIRAVSEDLGVDKSDYIRGLILQDLREQTNGKD